MQCLKPISIENPDYDSQNECFDKRIFVPCGKCAACIVNSANEWRVRLQEEFYNSDSAYFITLTYSDEFIPLQTVSNSLGDSRIAAVVSKRDIQLFLKRLRKHFEPAKIRYFLVSEYGPNTLRPHYHAIVFNLPFGYGDTEITCAQINKVIRQIWNRGNVLVDPVTYGRISYVTKYMSCVTDLPEDLPRPFRLMSRRPGIGSSYFSRSRIIDWHHDNLTNYYFYKGSKLRLPRFYRDKIYSDDERKQIKLLTLNFAENEQRKEESLSRSFGFDSWLSYRESQRTTFERKFQLKMKKNRKDL
ncbi:replication initiator protein [Peromfec virus RodF8_47]|uniref:Replication initiator protein n=1 Tax=Peromfec virus RodF8_47 TaxID=2929378 RepID=A0A976R795_9VIRU|nr:replication initiator protein [Peromfec virus RodF8_47]